MILGLFLHTECSGLSQTLNCAEPTDVRFDPDEIEVDCAVLVECLKDGTTSAGGKLVQVYNIPYTFSPSKTRSGAYLNFDPGCLKVRATIIFQKIWQLKLSKTAEEVMT